jgi:replication factor C small subunit
LWSNNPGTGKTSTATALIKEIGGEALFINASMDNGIDVLRSQISNFASTESFDGILKIVVLDEVDNLSQSAQFAFRSLIESFSNNCRFILTGNFKEKMLDPLLDRLENYDFNNFNKQEMVKPIFERLKSVLENEKVKYEPKDLVPIINTYYPSIRSMIGALQKFSTTGELIISAGDLDNQTEYSAIVDTVKAKDFNGMINLVNELTSPDNMFTFMYKTVSTFEGKMPQVVMILAKYQFQASSVRDKNLNLAACLTEIMNT